MQIVGDVDQVVEADVAGDAAHIMPPTGAKGKNLAITDLAVLARALGMFYTSGRTDGLEAYSDTCPQRVWKTQRFSAWMTNTLHLFAQRTPFDRRVKLAELDYLVHSGAAMQSLAENYVGLPLD